jgi:hypothetical protein
MTPQEREERGTATETGTEKEQGGGRSPATQASNGAGPNGSALRTAAKAGALAAAAGTTVYVTRKILRSEPGAQEGSDKAGAQTGQAGGEARKAGSGGSRFDAFVSTLNSQGLDAAANMLVPVAENAAHAAGAYAAEKSPDFLADTILPKFVDGFNEARRKLTRGSGSQQEAERPESS